jgi:hypothetical protein
MSNEPSLARRRDLESGGEQDGSLRAMMSRATSGVPAPLRPLVIGLVPMIIPQLGGLFAVAAAFDAAIAAAATKQLEEAVAGVGRTVRRVAKQVRRARRELTEEQVASLLRRGDVIHTMAEARDVYALEVLDARLARFAAVVAGRALSPEGSDFNMHLHFARAALELGDGGVRVLDAMRAEYQEGIDRGRVFDAPDAPQITALFSKLNLAAWLKTHSPQDANEVHSLRLDIETAKRLAFVIELAGPVTGTPGIADPQTIACADGTRVHGVLGVLGLTTWGLAFAERIREAEGESESEPMAGPPLTDAAD